MQKVLTRTPIHVLSQDIAERIAAGEVIEIGALDAQGIRRLGAVVGCHGNIAIVADAAAQFREVRGPELQ